MKFTRKHLQNLVNIAGAALEAEDRFITGCVTHNPIYNGDDRSPGILRFNDEKYYQPVIARGLLSSFPFYVEREGRLGTSRNYDLVLYRDVQHKGAQRSEPVAVGEIKRWFGDREDVLAGMEKDINRLTQLPCPSFLLVITAPPEERKEEWAPWLKEKLGLQKCYLTQPYRFRTRFIKGRNDWHVDFQVFAFLIA